MGRAFTGSGRFARAFKLPLLFHFSSVLLLSDDRYVNRRFADFRPGFSPHRPNNVQCPPSDIDATRDEAASARDVAICIFQRIANPTRAYLARVFVRAKSVPADGLIFFFFHHKSQWLRIRVSLTNTRL